MGDIKASEEKAQKKEMSGISTSEKQQVFGYTREDIKYLFAPMCSTGQEGIGSMGNDTPLAVLSIRSKPIFNYFKQLFAQVTNPPIDPIREAIVMSLVNFIGPRPNLLDINQTNPPLRIEVCAADIEFQRYEQNSEYCCSL